MMEAWREKNVGVCSSAIHRTSRIGMMEAWREKNVGWKMGRLEEGMDGRLEEEEWKIGTNGSCGCL